MGQTEISVTVVPHPENTVDNIMVVSCIRTIYHPQVIYKTLTYVLRYKQGPYIIRKQ